MATTITAQPPNKKGTKNLIQNQPTHIGPRRVIKKVGLGVSGIMGLVIPLGSDSYNRTEEVLEIMADAMSVFDCVPLGTMTKIRQGIEISTIRLENPEIDRFDVAIPLRKADQRQNYFQWDSNIHDWKISRINLSTLCIQSSSFMLIVKEHD